MAARASKVTRFINQILQVAETHFSRADRWEAFVEEVLRFGREFAGCKALDGRAGKINRSQPFIKVALPSLIRRLACRLPRDLVRDNRDHFLVQNQRQEILDYTIQNNDKWFWMIDNDVIQFSADSAETIRSRLTEIWTEEFYANAPSEFLHYRNFSRFLQHCIRSKSLSSRWNG